MQRTHGFDWRDWQRAQSTRLSSRLLEGLIPVLWFPPPLLQVQDLQPCVFFVWTCVMEGFLSPRGFSLNVVLELTEQRYVIICP